MTIKTLVDFYFAQYKKLDIKFELWGGLRGRYYTYTKKTFYDDFEEWLNEKVMTSNFETCTHNYVTLETKKLQHPKLYMCYKEN